MFCWRQLTALAHTPGQEATITTVHRITPAPGHPPTASTFLMCHSLTRDHPLANLCSLPSLPHSLTSVRKAHKEQLITFSLVLRLFFFSFLFHPISSLFPLPSSLFALLSSLFPLIFLSYASSFLPSSVISFPLLNLVYRDILLHSPPPFFDIFTR